MCVYCERKENLGWKNRPIFYDKNWEHQSDRIKDELHSNLNINGNPDWEARILDYKTSAPELLITSKNIASALWGEGTATLYLPIKYCPVCGRKLGEKKENT